MLHQVSTPQIPTLTRPSLPVTDGHADCEVSFDRERQSHEDGRIEGHRRHRIEDLSEQGVEGLKHRAERSVAVGKKAMRHVAADTVAPRRTLSRS